MENIEKLIREKANSKGLKKIARNYVNVGYIFAKTNCNFIKKELEQGNAAFALKVPGLKGFFSKNSEPFNSFSISLCNKLKKFDEGRGFITTDELPAYGISMAEVNSAKQIVGAGEDDLIIFVFASQAIAEKSLDLIASKLEIIIHT